MEAVHVGKWRGNCLESFVDFEHICVYAIETCAPLLARFFRTDIQDRHERLARSLHGSAGKLISKMPVLLLAKVSRQDSWGMPNLYFCEGKNQSHGVLRAVLWWDVFDQVVKPESTLCSRK